VLYSVFRAKYLRSLVNKKLGSDQSYVNDNGKKEGCRRTRTHTERVGDTQTESERRKKERNSVLRDDRRR
jgi:hypothetical protein